MSKVVRFAIFALALSAIYILIHELQHHNDQQFDGVIDSVCVSPDPHGCDAPVPKMDLVTCYPQTCNASRSCCQDFRRTCDYGVGSRYDCAVILPGVKP